MHQNVFSDAENILYTTCFVKHDPAKYWSILSSAEQKLAERKVNQHLQDQVVLSYGLRRSKLGALLGLDPKKLHFDFVANQKPILPNTPLHFNVSHSESHWVLLVNKHHAVGVDIESTLRDVDFLTLAERFFALEEVEQIKNSVAGQTIFWQLWTAKEALLKASGAGLHDLDYCKLYLDSEKIWKAKSARFQAWQLEQIIIDDSAMLTAAIPSGQRLLHHAF